MLAVSSRIFRSILVKQVAFFILLVMVMRTTHSQAKKEKKVVLMNMNSGSFLIHSQCIF